MSESPDEPVEYEPIEPELLDAEPEPPPDEPETGGANSALPEAGRPLGGDTDLVARDPLDRYFYEISRYPLLTREQEHELALRVHEREDADAAQQLVLSNLRLVVKIAMEYRRVWTNVLDLIQEGNIGLLQAVKRFDPHRGVKLSSYAAYWIRAYLLKYLIDNIRLVRVGSSRAERKLFFQLNRVKRELEREGFEPEPKLIADRIGVEEPEVIDMERRLAQGDLSIDAPVRSDEPEAVRFGDRLPAPERAVDDVVAEKSMADTFHRQIDLLRPELDERERMILDRRILATDPLTLQEVGDKFDLTRERVRQIEKRLVGRLRDHLRENLVDFEWWAPDA
ncbi:MAG: RNA polymerase factor sigma-32 [Proteobacteria bacterium]|nr:RNA polymerase factor sigma-32 [Pseudomonadota bacterium]